MAAHDPWTPWSVALAIATSFGGGLVSVARHYQQGKKMKVLGVVSELFIACFTGSLAFWVADEAFHQPEALCAAIAAIAGNMGGKLYDAVGHFALRHLEPQEPPHTIFPPYGPDFRHPQSTPPYPPRVTPRPDFSKESHK